MSENLDPNFEAPTPIDAPALEVNKSGRKRVHHTEEEKKEANKVACRKTRKRNKNTLAVLHDDLKNSRAELVVSKQEVATLAASKAIADDDAAKTSAEVVQLSKRLEHAEISSSPAAIKARIDAAVATKTKGLQGELYAALALAHKLKGQLGEGEDEAEVPWVQGSKFAAEKQRRIKYQSEATTQRRRAGDLQKKVQDLEEGNKELAGQLRAANYGARQAEELSQRLNQIHEKEVQPLRNELLSANKSVSSHMRRVGNYTFLPRANDDAPH